jgi:restriction system protein
MRATAQRSTRTGPWTAIALIALAVFAAQWIAHHLVVTIAVTTLALVPAVAFRKRLRSLLRRRPRLSGATDPHRLSAGQFEHYIADLCRRDGCTDVKVVGGAGDLAADVLATTPDAVWWQPWSKQQHRILIQAKRYAIGNNVKSGDVQCVNGTYRDIHRCQRAAVVTTSHFTKDAREFAERVGITTVDDTRLTAWIRGQRSAAPWN